jgi:tetratricopeptide (TPR) repeat protein
MTRLQQLLHFYEEDPDDSFTRFALAQEYLKQGQPEQALAFYEQLVADRPGYTGTYYHLGKLYEQMGRTEDAVATYQRGIQAAGQQKDFHARAELQDALLKVQGIGFEDEA